MDVKRESQTTTYPVGSVLPQKYLNTPQQGYCHLLQKYDWQWFVTLTFADPPHPEAAEKKFRLWVNRLNDRIYGKNWRRRTSGIYWCKALEYTKAGVIHFHALCGDVEPLYDKMQRQDAAKLWWPLGGIAKIDPIDNRDIAVLNYVSKYTIKGGELDFPDHMLKIPYQHRALSHII